ncbi:MAG TPA: acireductone synthase [Gammaproteobacteria bacterium]
MIKAIVTDIEGTTTSLAFVKEVLFPYARRHLRRFVRENIANAEVAAILDTIRSMVGKPLEIEEIAAQLEQWIDEDRKLTPLKALQGLIWEAGYTRGDFLGHVYDDAARNLQQWHAQGIQLYVYSSGSAHAQKLLFAHTPFGDLTPLFSGYFDTTIGQKRDSASYAAIGRQLGVSPSEILFLSDVREELDAARDVGMRTCWLVRDSVPNRGAEHTQAASFDEIALV